MPTITIPAISAANDVEVYKSGSSYPPGGDEGEGVITNADGVTIDNSLLASGIFRRSNVLVKWDTSVIPDDAIITGARLRTIYGSSYNTNSRSEVWEWYEFTTPSLSDHSITPPSSTSSQFAGEAALKPLSLNEQGKIYYLPLTNLDNINRNSTTAIRGFVGGNQPGGLNKYTIGSTESLSSSTSPSLEVTYELPVPKRGQSMTTSGLSTSATVTRPNRTSSQAYSPGDIIVVSIAGPGTTTLPSGWNRISMVNSAAEVFWKVMGPSEPTSYTFSFSTSGTYAIQASLIYDTKTPLTIGTPVRDAARSLTTGSFSVPGNSLLMGINTFSGNSQAVATNAVGLTPTGMTAWNHINSADAGTAVRLVSTFTQDMPDAQVLSKTFTLSSNTTPQNHHALLIAFPLSALVVGPPGRTDFPRTVHTPQNVRRGSVRVGALARLDHPRTFYDPSVRLGSVRISPARFEGYRETYEPRINAGQLAFLDRTPEYYPLNITTGAITVGSVAFLDRSYEVYVPTVRLTQVTVRPARTDHLRAVYDPQVRLTTRTLGPTQRTDHQRTAYTPTRLRLTALTIPLVRYDHQREAFGVRINPELTDDAQDRKTERIRSHALSGRRGVIHYEPRLFLSNIYGEELAPLPGVTSASVSLSNYRDNTWELALEVGVTDAFDPARDYVMCAMDVRAGRDPVERFPLGLYRFEFPSGADDPVGSSWSLTGESLETLLMRGMATKGFRVAPGAGVLDTVRSLLASRGVPASRINFPHEPAGTRAVIKNGSYYDVIKDEEGAYFIRIANDLLGNGGFGAIQTNEYGQFTTSKNISLEEKNPTVLYAPPGMDGHLPADDMLLAGPIPRQPSYDRFANEVFVYSQDVNQEPAISGVARNNNPNSPVSIQNLGYTVTKTIARETISTQEVADTMAKAELARSTAFHMVRDILTMPDPRRGADEAYRIIAINDSGKRVMDGKWLVTNWELELSEEPGEMRHQVSRTEEF